KELQPIGIAANGPVLNPQLWIHATMPAVTVESAYLTNPANAALLRQPRVLDKISQAIGDGVEAQAPQIKQIKAQMAAYRAAQARVAAAAAPKPAQLPVLPLAAVAMLAVLAVTRWRWLVLAGAVLAAG